MNDTEGCDMDYYKNARCEVCGEDAFLDWKAEESDWLFDEEARAELDAGEEVIIALQPGASPEPGGPRSSDQEQ